MKIPITEIKINDRVRRTFEDIEDLAQSIKEVGLIQPITLTKDNELIAGHRRLLACKKLGMTEIECFKVSPSDELHKLDMELAENVKRKDFNPMELAEGLQKRKQLYEAIHPETKTGQAQALGMNRKLGYDVKTESDSTFVEDTAKKIGKSETFVKEHLQLNDLDEDTKQDVRDSKKTKSEALAKFRKQKRVKAIKENVKEISSESINLYEGDCLVELDKIKDNSIACLIIDPPYGIDYQSNHKLERYAKLENDSEEVFDLLDKSLKKVKPKMLSDSHIYIFTTWKVYEKVKPIVEKHFEVKNCLIWNKNNWSMGDLQGNYAEKYEMIIFATQGKRPITSNVRPVNVLDFARTSNSNHPTEKPVDLLRALINNSTVEKETVLDYFAGSGSTLVASKETNRNFVGIELSKEYCEMIKFRLNKEDGKQLVFFKELKKPIETYTEAGR